jgi:glucose-6-phosphate 1-dehydrogenase
MEPPASFEADPVRNEKVKVLSAIRSINLKNTVRAQYDGYRQTTGVLPDSQTATYAAMKLYIDNWRWKGVPFYLRSGKALAGKSSEIIIEFQRPPHLMFAYPDEKAITPNILSMCIQPDEGIHLKFEAKVPGAADEMRDVDMEFHYQDSFGDIPLPDAYERLLLDALNSDASLFTRSDGIETAWRLIDPLLEGWETPGAPPLVKYSPGSWGPTEANELLARDDRRWRLGCREH